MDKYLKLTKSRVPTRDEERLLGSQSISMVSMRRGFKPRWLCISN